MKLPEDIIDKLDWFFAGGQPNCVRVLYATEEPTSWTVLATGLPKQDRLYVLRFFRVGDRMQHSVEDYFPIQGKILEGQYEGRN